MNSAKRFLRKRFRSFDRSCLNSAKHTFFKCSDKNESFYLQKVCFSDREKSSELLHLNCDPWELSFTEDLS
ncbi:hypothetical protein LEP1GSC021_2800 [Leptospira noguchii str. 1993005606]|nr:hypothetical protein LEP1GSC021_2800 [Leptospira noguchii str. 1993005606]